MPAPSWAPSPDQVAAVLRARTRGTGTGATRAGELGRFTAATRPTLDEVVLLIEQACGDVLAAFEGREPCSLGTNSAARSAATYIAAQLVEVSYFPETSKGEGSAFEALQKLAETTLRSAAVSVAARCPFTPGEEGDGGALAPTGRGRDPRYPVKGFGFQW